MLDVNPILNPGRLIIPVFLVSEMSPPKLKLPNPTYILGRNLVLCICFSLMGIVPSSVKLVLSLYWY